MSDPDSVFGPPEEKSRRYIQSVLFDWDNDQWRSDGTDRDYTDGVRLTYRRSRSEFRSAPQSIYTNAYGMHVGQNMYTPSNLRLTPAEIDRKDHPYGAWLYAGLWKEEYRSNRSYVRYEFNVGCIGPCAAGEDVQKWVHELTDSKEPKGWDLQVKNELGVLARLEYVPKTYSWGGDLIDLEIVPRLGADLGNVFLQAFAGGMIRAGKMAPFHCGTETGPIIYRLQGAIDPGDMEAKRHAGSCDLGREASQLYGFFRIDGKAVAYNALLQGPMFSDGSPHTVSPRRLVVDMEIGGAFQSGRFTVRYSLASRSTEHKEQDFELRRYRFGRVQFGWHW